MDVAITPSSPAALPYPRRQEVSDLDAEVRAQARQVDRNEQVRQTDRNVQERIDQEKLANHRALEARQAQTRQQYTRNFNGELIGTTVSTTA